MSSPGRLHQWLFKEKGDTPHFSALSEFLSICNHKVFCFTITATEYPLLFSIYPPINLNKFGRIKSLTLSAYDTCDVYRKKWVESICYNRFDLISHHLSTSVIICHNLSSSVCHQVFLLFC